MIPAPTTIPFDDNGQPSKAWIEWANIVSRQPRFWGNFTTADRPTNGVNDGDWILDTTLGYPVYYYSSGWINSSGTSV